MEIKDVVSLYEVGIITKEEARYMVQRIDSNARLKDSESKDE